MHYKNYLPDVVLKHHVQLTNWPASVPFESPSDMNSILSVDKLMDALMTGTCKWVSITKRQAEEMVQEARKDGKPLKATRAKRSDAGGSHRKPRDKKRKHKTGDGQGRQVRRRTDESEDESDS
jgi:hypothetical protein